MSSEKRWVVATANRKLVASRKGRADGITYGDDVSSPVPPFHAVVVADPGGRAACGAEVRWSFDDMDFGTRAQNCPRCAATVGRS